MFWNFIWGMLDDFWIVTNIILLQSLLIKSESNEIFFSQHACLVASQNVYTKT